VPEVKFLSGNEACVEGALIAGLGFYAGYPITPSTEIAEMLSERLPKEGKFFIQMEDEIASMAAIIGASIGGKKAMTATSGPGFSLMQENIGYAVEAEIPCVVVDVQRAGPSTGGPTSPAQGDMMQARWGTHGDHPIIALCPSSISETLELTIRAFNLSEKYRIPVIILMDEVIGHMRERVVVPAPGDVEIFNRIKPTCPPYEYFPYENVESLVPPLAAFGDGYRFHITGLFHDISGFPTMRADEIVPWFNRLFKKIDDNLDDILLYEMRDMEDAEIAVISFGISARSALAAQKTARLMGKKVGLMKLQTIWPFPEKAVQDLASKVKLILVPEMNHGQMILEVQRASRDKCLIKGVNKLDCEIIYPHEIIAAMEV
jgi:2-oxoglutarate ferredoxin oxidoreductase subunit alpha